MTRLIIPRAGQPQGVVRPNRSHFFGAECDYLWTPGNDGGRIRQVRTFNGLAGVPNAAFNTGTSRNLGLRPWCSVLVMMFPTAQQSGTLFNAGNNTGGARLVVATVGSSIQLNWVASTVGTGTNRLVETGVAFNKIAGVLVTNWTAAGCSSWFKRPGKPVFTWSETLAIVSPTDFSVVLAASGTIGVELAAISSGVLNQTQVRSLLENPWQIVEPLARNSRVRAATGGTPTLTIADSTHGHAADNLVLTSSTDLVIAEATHGHAADNLTLDAPTGTSLTVADATHAHTADALTLSTDAWLTVADALHAHAADNLTLTLDTWLTVADALHAHAADNLTLTLDTWLVVADALHAHAADNLALTLDTWLVVADALHAHAADNLALTLDTWLAIQDAVHAHTADNLHFGGLYSTLDLIYKILANRQELNPTTGKFTLYDDDGVSVLYQANAWADAAGTIPYTGGTLARIDALA